MLIIRRLFLKSLHYLLMKSNSMFSRIILAEAGRLGLTPGQPKILDFLLVTGEADQKTIAAYCEIEQPTVGSILLRMENSGLVKRRQKDGNRRSLYVSLTEKGTEKAEKLAEIFANAEAQALSSFSEDEKNEFIRLLSLFSENTKSICERKKAKQ